MFKTPLLVSLLALFLIGGTIGVGLLKLRPRDFKIYQQLVESSKPSKQGSLISYSQQARENVSKEIWFQEDVPLHCRIHCKASELFFFHDEKNKVEIVEEMEDVQGILQEELFYLLPDGREVLKKRTGKFLARGADPAVDASWIDCVTSDLTPMQMVRYFEAEKASYNYNTQLFVGEVVKLWKYRLPGHTPPTSLETEFPSMQGTAKSVEFTVKGEEFQFTAKELKATFDPKKGAI